MPTIQLTTYSRLALALALPLLLLIYLWLVWPGLFGPFLFDDYPNLANLNSLYSQGVGFNIGDYLSAFEGDLGRPISALSFLLNDIAWPSDPFAFKYTNVMLHMLNCVLLFGLIRQISFHSNSLPNSPWFALIASACWLFHPMLLSAQMLAVQRMTVLSATFCLAGLWAYVKLVTHANTVSKSLIAISVLGLFTVLAILSKESGALLPLFALAIQTTLLGDALSQRAPFIERISIILISVPCLLVVLIILFFGLQNGTFDSREFTLNERLLTQIHVVSDYLKQLAVPTLTNSGIYHDDYPITRSIFESSATIFKLLIISTIAFLAIWKRRQWPLFAFATIWFFVGHLMESTVIPLELYFEHRNYLPAIGPIMAVVALPFTIAAYRKTIGFVVAAWLCLLVGITSLQARLWGNWELLSTVWSTEHPLSLRATQEHANFLLVSGNPEQAISVYLAGYDRGINSPDLILSAIYISCHENRPIQNDLLSKSIMAIGKAPYGHGSFSLLQFLRSATTAETCPHIFNRNDWFKISEAFLANSKLKQQAEDFIRIERARAFLDNGQHDMAILELTKAYQISPNIELSRKIAVLMISLNRHEDAKLWLRKGLALKKSWRINNLSSQNEQSQALLNSLE